MTRSKILTAGMMFSGLLPASAWASLLTVTTYSMPNGDNGTYVYLDTTYTPCPANSCTTIGAQLSGGLGRLTNGVIPTTDWNVNGNAAGWIDWAIGAPNNTDPTVTFTFAHNSTINSVSIVFDNSLGYGGILPPASVTIDGANYAITASSIEGPETVTISGLDLTGSDATVQFFQDTAEPSVGESMMIGQVSFNGTASVSAAPEPGSVFLIGGGLLAALIALNLRRGNRGANKARPA